MIRANKGLPITARHCLQVRPEGVLRSGLPRAPTFFSLAPSILFSPTLTLTLLSPIDSRALLTICSIFPTHCERLTFPGSMYPRLYLVRIPALVIVAQSRQLPPRYISWPCIQSWALSLTWFTIQALLLQSSVWPLSLSASLLSSFLLSLL